MSISNITVSQLTRNIANPFAPHPSSNNYRYRNINVYATVAWEGTLAASEWFEVEHEDFLASGARKISATRSNFLRIQVSNNVDANVRSSWTRSYYVRVRVNSPSGPGSWERHPSSGVNVLPEITTGPTFSSPLSFSGRSYVLPEWSGYLTATLGSIYLGGNLLLDPENLFGILDVQSGGRSVERLVLTWRPSSLGGIFPQELSSPQGTLIYAEVVTNSTQVNASRHMGGLAELYVDGANLIGLSSFVFGDRLVKVDANYLIPAGGVTGTYTVNDIFATAAKGKQFSIPVEATHSSTFALSGNPSWMSLEQNPLFFGTSGGRRPLGGPSDSSGAQSAYYLTGIAPASGLFEASITGTRMADGVTDTAEAKITVVDSLPRTVIGQNAAISRDGITAAVGDEFSLALESTPAGSIWEATGLPGGITLDQSGRVAGTFSRAGIFFASITAAAKDHERSVPLTIRFVIGVGTAIESTAAAERSPWLLDQWELTDLHILARGRAVESTMFEKGVLRIKIGDAINFAIFFVDVTNSVFAMAPTQLRLTIRKEDNLDDLIIFKSGNPPAAATQDGQTYYLMPVTTGNREREVALEWAEENAKNEPLKCAADLDWIKDGKLYSSRTFPVLLDLDVTRP